MAPFAVLLVAILLLGTEHIIGRIFVDAVTDLPLRAAVFSQPSNFGAYAAPIDVKVKQRAVITTDILLLLPIHRTQGVSVRHGFLHHLKSRFARERTRSARDSLQRCCLWHALDIARDRDDATALCRAAGDFAGRRRQCYRRASLLRQQPTTVGKDKKKSSSYGSAR